MNSRLSLKKIEQIFSGVSTKALTTEDSNLKVFKLFHLVKVIFDKSLGLAGATF